MGNVFASSIAPTPVPPLNLPDSNETQSSSAHRGSNPGTLEDLHKKCKDIFPMMFEGGKFVVNKALSNHLQISHSLNMSSTMPSGYRFGATYVGTQQTGPMEMYPILLGEIDPSGNMNATALHQYQNFRFKLAAQVQENKFVATQFSSELKGPDYTASVILGNIDVINGSGITVLHYLQNVAPSIDLGAELAYQYGSQVTGGQMTIMSIAGRYTTPEYVVSGTLGAASAHMCFYRKGNENIQVGVEVETNLRLEESTCTLGYQVDLPKANMVFRGMFDTNWTVGAVLEKKLQPLPFSLALSGMINHVKNSSRFGIGLVVGG